MKKEMKKYIICPSGLVKEVKPEAPPPPLQPLPSILPPDTFFADLFLISGLMLFIFVIIPSLVRDCGAFS